MITSRLSRCPHQGCLASRVAFPQGPRYERIGPLRHLVTCLHQVASSSTSLMKCPFRHLVTWSLSHDHGSSHVVPQPYLKRATPVLVPRRHPAYCCVVAVQDRRSRLLRSPAIPRSAAFVPFARVEAATISHSFSETHLQRTGGGTVRGYYPGRTLPFFQGNASPTHRASPAVIRHHCGEILADIADHSGDGNTPSRPFAPRYPQARYRPTIPDAHPRPASAGRTSSVGNARMQVGTRKF